MQVYRIYSLFSVLFIDYVQSSTVKVNPRVDPLVLTDQGLVRGERSSNGQYSSFLGIPYAQVDYDNPFGESQPHPGFGDAVFNAYEGTIACPQLSQEGTLDCLRLNIYVPTVASSRNPMPVLVWIHGGSFTNGEAGYFIGDNIVDKDIVLVTINYRLGPYGFMCLDVPAVPGNQGLKDQLAALRWVKDNISAFGGNPYNVTVAGQSAGGTSVEYHMYSSQEKLFQKAILQSGVAQISSLFVEADINAAIKIAEYLGFNTTDTELALQFLASASPSLVTAASNELGLLLGPCKEKSFSGIENFIETDPFSMSNRKKIANTLILVGTTSNELHQWEIDTSSNVFRNILEHFFNLSEDKFDKAEAMIRHYYIGDQSASESVKSELETFLSDFVFVHPVERSITKFLDENAGQIYQYVFDYAEENDAGEASNVMHSSELKYLFAKDYDSFSEEQKNVSDIMTSLWTNFIKYGNPTPATTELVPKIWEPVTSDSRPYMAIKSSGAHVEHRFRRESMAFWDLFYETYGQYSKLTRLCNF